jgi:DNA polymerase-3 subunit delta'
MGNAVELVNVELRSELAEFAGRSSAEATLARMDAINKARQRITTTNVAPLLAIESMAASLI